MDKYVISAMKRELKRNQSLIDWMDSFENPHPCHALEVKRNNGRLYYYLSQRVDGKKKRIYLGKGDSPKVRRVIAGRFRKERLRILEENNEVLTKALKEYQRDDRDAVYAHLPAVYATAGREFFIDKRYEELRAWAREEYEKNDLPFPEKEHYTCDHTRVRSKGEVIWYDLLYAAGIPFRYDCVLYYYDDTGLKKRVCPDFMIKCYDGTILIIEHLGYMSEDWYSNDFGTKCKYYLKEGYVLGRNFFVTSDDMKGGTDACAIASLVRHVEELFYYGVPDIEKD